MNNEMRSNGWSAVGNSAAAGLLVALSIVCVAMLAFRTVAADEVRFLFMVWNLFLAWLPFVASSAAVALRRFESKPSAYTAIVACLGILWLLFYPNAAYLTTDFIHLIANRPAYMGHGTVDYMVWYDLILFFFFAWCGIFLGFLSQYQIHRLVAGRIGETAGWLFVIATSALGGYGVFLGRIVRLNSWDALVSPRYLIGEVLGNLHWRGFWFSALFGLFMLTTYGFLYALQGRKGSYANRNEHTM
ncbi:DUF1361 domain-containing protein [Paenibacillus sp. TRM 82003]|nr:DUF1361 domain-containing protein [Paenibacillus sp. TRM 82003]